jgi:hypothetical protein
MMLMLRASGSQRDRSDNDVHAKGKGRECETDPPDSMDPVPLLLSVQSRAMFSFVCFRPTARDNRGEKKTLASFFHPRVRIRNHSSSSKNSTTPILYSFTLGAIARSCFLYSSSVLAHFHGKNPIWHCQRRRKTTAFPV